MHACTAQNIGAGPRLAAAPPTPYPGARGRAHRAPQSAAKCDLLERVVGHVLLGRVRVHARLRIRARTRRTGRTSRSREGVLGVYKRNRPGGPQLPLHTSSRSLWPTGLGHLNSSSACMRMRKFTCAQGASADESPGREEQVLGNVQGYMCGSCTVQSRRAVGRGARAPGLGAVGRTHLMALEPCQPKPRADRRLSDWLRIWSWRGLAQHGEHRRDAAASTRSSTSTGSGAGASLRSAGRSQWRPRARRRPQHSQCTTVVTREVHALTPATCRAGERRSPGGVEAPDIPGPPPSNDQQQLGGLGPPPSNYLQPLGGSGPPPSNEQQRLGVDLR